MSPRERTLAIVAGAVVALIIGWRLVLSPVVAKAGELRSRTAAARAAIETENALAERADAIEAKDARLFSATDLADVGTVEAAFLGFVNRSAEDSSIKISSERPSNNVHLPSGGRGGYAEIQVALTGEGALGDYVRFLDRLAGGDRPLRVVAASLSRTDKAGVLAINMRLSTVAVREEAK